MQMLWRLPDGLACAPQPTYLMSQADCLFPHEAPTPEGRRIAILTAVQATERHSRLQLVIAKRRSRQFQTSRFLGRCAIYLADWRVWKLLFQHWALEIVQA